MNSPTILGLEKLSEPFFKNFVEGYKDAAILWKTKNIKEFSEKAQKKIQDLKKGNIKKLSKEYTMKNTFLSFIYLFIFNFSSEIYNPSIWPF